MLVYSLCSLHFPLIRAYNLMRQKVRGRKFSSSNKQILHNYKVLSISTMQHAWKMKSWLYIAENHEINFHHSMKIHLDLSVRVIRVERFWLGLSKSFAYVGGVFFGLYVQFQVYKSWCNWKVNLAMRVIHVTAWLLLVSWLFKKHWSSKTKVYRWL